MFDEENLISLAIFLSFCPSTYVHPNPANHETANSRKNILNHPYFFAKFSHDFFRLFCEIFVFSISRTFRIFFAKQIEEKVREKNRKCSYFLRSNEMQTMRNFRRKKKIFLFRWKP